MNDTWFKERKYAWIGLAALWIIGFIGALLRFIMATYQVQISQDLNISRSLISMALVNQPTNCSIMHPNRRMDCGPLWT